MRVCIILANWRTGERSDLCRKDFRSVMPLAQEVRKPMFLLNRADGATNGHAGTVSDCCQRDLPEDISQMHLVRRGQAEPALPVVHKRSVK